MFIFKKIAGATLVAVALALLIISMSGSAKTTEQKILEKQEWCLAQGGEFTRHGSGWGPDWSCTITNGK